MANLLRVVPTLAALVLPLGCSDGGGNADGCDLEVEAAAGQEGFVTAFVELEDGQTLCVGPGVFELSRQVTLLAANATVRGAGRSATILDFSGQQSGANGLLIEGDGVALEDLQIKNTPGDGIRANDVDGIRFERIDVVWDAQESEDNGAYGLYPVQSSDVVIRDCMVRGARDAGIYVGQSTNVLVEHSEAYGNVAGIEIENTTDAVVRRNSAHDNTAGILVFNLPGLDIKDGKRANVYENTIENNNVANFGDPGTVVGIVPPGIGLLVLATDDNEFHNNIVRGNRSVGIAIISYLQILFDPPNDPEYDIFSEGNYVHDNTWENNGYDVDGLVTALNGSKNPGPTIVFDGCFDADKDNTAGALDNCISNVGGATFWSADFCGQIGMGSSDIAAATCMHEPLPSDRPGLAR